MIENIILKQFVCGPLEVNSYIFGPLAFSAKKEQNKYTHNDQEQTQPTEVVIIDPGGCGDKIINNIEKNNLKPTMIILTHGHLDHIVEVSTLKKKFNIDIAIHKKDAYYLSNSDELLEQIFGKFHPILPDKLLEDDDTIKIGTSYLKVIHTPGHTPGGICLLYDSILFTGDTLFAAGIGRTDLPGGDYQTLKDSLTKKLLPLPDDITILPGHGPRSQLGIEKRRSIRI